MYDVIIIGAGPAGITSAIYCARSNLKVALLDKGLIGGNILNYLEIQNYPGFGNMSTSDLADKFLDHLDLYENITRFEFAEIQNIDLDNKVVTLVDKELHGKFIIIATGSKPRMLNVPGEREYIGQGVHYCAICDGPLYRDKIVAVIGGGNSACEEALGLAKLCKKVHIIEFTDKLNAEQTTLDKIKETKNIEVITGYAVTKIEEITEYEKSIFLKPEQVNEKLFKIIAEPRCKFEPKSDGPVSYNADPPTYKLWVSGIFVYVGMSPNLPNLTNENCTNPYLIAGLFHKDGYILTNEDMETTIKDIYAVGDIRAKKYRQVITAMNDGAIAAIHISKQI